MPRTPLEPRPFTIRCANLTNSGPQQTALALKRSAQLVAKQIGGMFKDWDFDPSPPRTYATVRLRFIEFANAPVTPAITIALLFVFL